MKKKSIMVLLMVMTFVVGDAQASFLALQRLSVLKQVAIGGACCAAFSTRVRRPGLKGANRQDELKKLKLKVGALEQQLAQKNQFAMPSSTALVVTDQMSNPELKNSDDLPSVDQKRKDALYDAKMRAMTLFLKMNDTNNLFPRWNLVGTKLKENKVVSLVEFLEKEGQVKFVKDFAVIQDAMKEGILFDARGHLRSYNVPTGEARDLLHLIDRERNSEKFWNTYIAVDVVSDSLRSYMWYSMGRSEGRRESGAQHPDVASPQAAAPVDGAIDPLEPSAPSSLEKGSASSSEELIDTARTSGDDAKELVDAAKISSDAPAEELSDVADLAASGVAEVSKGILESIGDFFSGFGD